jgi:hypothetical protein
LCFVWFWLRPCGMRCMFKMKLSSVSTKCSSHG